MLYTIPFGFSVAICTLCGNLLGAMDVESAKRVVSVGMGLAFAVSIVLSGVIVVASSVIPLVSILALSWGALCFSLAPLYCGNCSPG